MRLEKHNVAYTAFAGHLKECRKVMRQLSVFSIISNVLMLAIPVYAFQLFDRVITTGSSSTLLMLSLITAGALLGIGIIQVVRSYLQINTGEWLETQLSPTLFAHSIAKKAQTSGTSALSQDLRDLNVIKNFATSPNFTTLLDAPWSLLFIAVSFTIHPVIGSIALAGGAILLVVAILNESSTRKALDKSNDRYLHSFGQTEAAARNAESIEAMGMLAEVTNDWWKSASKAMFLQTRADKRSAIFSGIAKFLRLATLVAVIGAGTNLVVNNELTTAAIIAGAILVSFALTPLENSINSWRSFIAARKSYNRLESSLIKSSSREEGMSLPAPKGTLDLEEVFFIPHGSRKTTIKRLNFSLKPGEILGVMGPSAAGKSTLAKLITGVWKPSAGTIRLDRANVYKWQRADFGKYVGYLPQDVELFNGTIRDNIARMNKTADPTKIVKATEMVGAHKMILQLPRGYDTEIGPANNMDLGVAMGASNSILSKGQMQRICLARAFYGDPKLVVLDEPNSNLDSDGEVALLATLLKAKEKGITTIIISHRPALMMATDKILIMRDGTVSSFGTRDEILERRHAEISSKNTGRPEIVTQSSQEVKRDTLIDA